jgi:uncharacterized membrane protein
MPLIHPDKLRSIPLFELLDDQEAAVLAQHLDEINVLGGQTIFEAGDEGGTMYVVESGQVEIFLRDKNDEYVVLGFVAKGGLFGDLSLLDNQPRSASAKAVEDTTLFVIDRNDLSLLIKAHPHAALDMMAMLGKRIRETDLLLRDRVVTRNVNEEIAQPATIGERLSDFLTRVAGDIRFVYASLIWFGLWLIWNAGLVPGLKPFDPNPYGLLTMVVSLEAIFLSLFVLISQNRQAAREKVRNDIEYEVNIKGELEVRQLHKRLDEMEQLMLRHLARMNTHLETSAHQTVSGNSASPETES